MLDFVRKHNRIMMFVLVLLIIPAFVLVGVGGYERMLGQSQTVARIGKLEITQAEWDQAHRQEVDRLRRLMPSIDAKLLDSDLARYASLERLVRERELQQAARQARMQVSDARLAAELQALPALSRLKSPDGKLDLASYRELLAAQGMSPEVFESQLRDQLTTRRLLASTSQATFVPKTASELALAAHFEQREIQLVRFAPAQYLARVQASDADLQAFYQANQVLFQTPEQVDIDYLVLDLDAVRKSIKLSEQDLRSYYDSNVQRLSGAEERRASHILIAVDKDASEQVRAQARLKAQELLAQARQAPDSFAALARKYSQDSGSASQGGDLNFFGRGAMVKPFEDVAFALKKGEISDLVQSDYGFHIIKLTDIKTPKQKSFTELRPSLEQELKNQQARAKYAEEAELFTNGVYEQSDSLKPVANKLGLEIQSAQSLGRQPALGAQGVLANPKFLQAVFSPDALQHQRNTEAVEIAPNVLAAARVTRHSPARTLPLAEVRTTVRERVLQARAAESARQEGQQKLAAWKADPAEAKLPNAQLVSREQNQNLPQAVLDAVLRADPSQLPQWLGIDLGPQGYAVVRVNKSIARSASEGTSNAERQKQAQYIQTWMQAELQAYYQLLQERLKTQIKVPRPAAASDLGAS